MLYISLLLLMRINGYPLPHKNDDRKLQFQFNLLLLKSTIHIYHVNN